jgi:hypothetical protein
VNGVGRRIRVRQIVALPIPLRLESVPKIIIIKYIYMVWLQRGGWLSVPKLNSTEGDRVA